MAKSIQISLEKIKRAKIKLENVVKETSLIYSERFSKLSGNTVYLKPENLQITGSYKIRGAYNKISSLSEKQKKKGLIAASAGNHAQGVAWAAKKLGAKAIIVMPTTTPLVKINATKKLGANVVLFGNIYDESCDHARRLARKKGYSFIHPFDDWEIMAGQGTVGLEVLNELPSTDILLVPVGGGGLIGGISVAAKSINPKIKIIGVEPKGANAMKLSLERRRLVELESADTIADGVAVKKVGNKTLEVAKKYVDRIVVVSETEIMEAFLMLMEKHKILAEPAGVLTVACFFNNKIKFKNKRIVSILSGGNIDVKTIGGLIDLGLVKLGRVFEFSTELYDRPGELVALAKVLSDNNANVIKTQYDQYKSVDRFKKVKITIVVETQGHEHIKKILNALKKEKYDVHYKG